VDETLRAARFLDAFNRIDAELRKRTGLGRDTGSFMAVLVKAMGGNVLDAPFLRNRREQFEQLNQLRNFMVHEFRTHPLAEPTEETVKSIEALAELVLSPVRVSKVMTLRPRVLEPGDTLATALAIMTANDFSQVLVQGADGLSLLSGEHLRVWLGHKLGEDIVSLEETTVGEVLACVDDAGLGCIGLNATVGEALEEFEKSIARGRPRVLATHSGKPTEKALGIITPWDVMN
jgi:CBS domain-containing protein